MTSPPPTGPFRIGEVLYDPAEGSVWVEGQRVQLPPRLAALLEHLARAAPRLVTKEELLDRVWEDSIVSEAALTQRIKELRAVLGDDARHPRYIETVSRRGYRLIARVHPADPPPAEEPRAAVLPPSSPQSTLAAAHPRRGWAFWAVVAALIVGATILWSLSGQHRERPSPPTVAARRAVVVLGFANLSGRPEDDWLDDAFTHLLATELSSGGRVRVLPSEIAHRVCQELDVRPAGPLSPATATRVGRAAGADLLASGSYLVQGPWPDGQVRLDLVLQDTLGGEPLLAIAVARPLSGLLALVDEAGQRLREALGLPPLSEGERATLAAMLPSSPEAARHYGQGLFALGRFNFPGALEAFQRAVAVDPDSSVAHAALADAWDWLGDGERAREESRLAWQLSGPLSREAQLAAEQGYRERSGEWGRAVELARVLWEFYPDNLDYGLSLASVLSKTGDDVQAAAVLDTLRGLPPPLGSDPRIDLAEAWLHDTDPARKLAAADRAAATAEAAGARLLLAAAHVQQGMARRAQGELAIARAKFDEARRIRLASGDAWGVAKVQEHLGALAHDQGDVAGAERLLSEALATAQQGGATGDTVRLLCRLAWVATDAGQLSRARTILEEALRLGRTLGGGFSPPTVDLELTRLDLAEGRYREAAARAGKLLASPSLDAKSLTRARVAVLLAEALAHLGHDGKADGAADEAVRIAENTSDLPMLLTARITEARVRAAAGDGASAVEQLQSLRERAVRAGLVLVELETLLAQAEVQQRLGDRRNAEAALGELTRRARGQGLHQIARRAESLLIRS